MITNEIGLPSGIKLAEFSGAARTLVPSGHVTSNPLPFKLGSGCKAKTWKSVKPRIAALKMLCTSFAGFTEEVYALSGIFRHDKTVNFIIKKAVTKDFKSKFTTTEYAAIHKS